MEPINAIERLLQPVLCRPADLKIASSKRGGAEFISVMPHGMDASRVVGTNGVNIKALKLLAAYIGTCRDAGEVQLTLLDAARTEQRAPRAAIDPRWKPDDLQARIRDYFAAVGESVESIANHQPTGWRITLSTVMPEDVFRALNRWVCVIAMSTGGSAFLDESARATV